MGGGGGGGGNNFDFFDSADDFTKMLLPFLRSNVNKFPCTFALYFFQCKNFKENEVKGNYDSDRLRRIWICCLAYRSQIVSEYA